MYRVWYEVRSGDEWTYVCSTELQRDEAEKMAAFFRRWPGKYRNVAIAS